MYLTAKRNQFTLEKFIDLNTRTPEELLKQIYAENYSWVETYVCQNSGTDADARDLFQESVTAAWINVREGRFEGDSGQFRAYLRQICRFKWINQLRANTRGRVVYGDPAEQPDLVMMEADMAEEQLYKSELLGRGWLQLGEKCKDVLKLFYYKRKSLVEIAGVTGDTEESLKTIKYRCMMRLRKFFMEEMTKDGKL